MFQNIRCCYFGAVQCGLFDHYYAHFKCFLIHVHNTGTYRLHLNDTIVHSEPLTRTWTDLEKIYIGAYSMERWEGYIYSLEFYTRALTPEEIAKNYKESQYWTRPIC